MPFMCCLISVRCMHLYIVWIPDPCTPHLFINMVTMNDKVNEWFIAASHVHTINNCAQVVYNYVGDLVYLSFVNILFFIFLILLVFPSSKRCTIILLAKNITTNQ